MTRVPADEQRLREVREDLRDWPRDDLSYLAQLTVHAADEIDRLLALLRLREQEADEAKTPHWAGAERLAETMAGWSPGSSHANHDAAMETLRAERDAALREAAEYRETNESVRVCADHTAEIVNGGGCLVCSLAAAETALRDTDERIERGRHAFEMLRHWNATGQPSKVMPWVDTFLREGGSIFSRRAVLVADPAAEETR